MNRQEYKKIVGKKIRTAREARGFTLDELAERTGYSSRSALSYIERGERSLSTTRAQIIAQALRVEFTWLISDEDLPPVFIEQSPIEEIEAKLSPENLKKWIEYAELLILKQKGEQEADHE